MSETIAVVTGANQGLGYALVEGLRRELPAGSITYLTARDLDRGQAAARALGTVGGRVEVAQLDVTDDASLARFAELVRARHGGVDVVVSNAAARISKDVAREAQVRGFVETNNRGTYRVLRVLGPLTRPGGTMLVVASAFGTLRNLPAQLHARFAPERTLEELDAELVRYCDLVEQGRDVAEGWPAWINIPSKIGQVAAMRRFAVEAPQLFVAGVCPGLVDTDASRPWFADMSSAQSPAAAAVDVVWLALASDERASLRGELVQHRKIVPWRQ